MTVTHIKPGEPLPEEKEALLYAQRRDNNEPEIVEVLNAVGAYVQQMDKSAGFDLLVTFRGIDRRLEVKSEKGKLTENELEVKRLVEAAGGTYYIVRSVDEALEAIGAIE